MLRTLWRNGWRPWSGFIPPAGSRSALAPAPAVSRAWGSVVETLETRAMLSGDLGTTGDADGDMAVTAIEAPGGVIVTRPVITIEATDPKAHETDRDRGVFTLTRTGSTNKSLNVTFTVRGSAKNGVDYDKIASSVLFPAGTRSVTIKIRPIDDTRVEEPETVTLVLDERAAYAIDGNGTAKVGIRNNDGPKVNITATDTSAHETNNDRGVFRITRTGSTDEPLVVRYTVYGKATNGLDYERVIDKLTIPAGDASETIAIRPVNDLQTELTESVRIQLRIGKYLVGEQGKASLSLRDNDPAPAPGEGFITFRAPDGEGQSGHVFHMPARIGAVPTDVTRALDQIGGKGGIDSVIGLSPDGEWIVLHTNRFDTDGDDFDLAVYPVNNLGGGTLVAFDSGPVQPIGKSAIGSGGNLIVFESNEGPHETDLWAAVRDAGSWSKVLLTGDSPYAFNSSPSISDDGTKLLFTGGDEGIGEAILEVKADAGELREVIGQGDGPEGSPTDAPIGAADYGAGGSIFFQAGWNGGNQIWWLNAGATTPGLFSSATNESTPSVLSDGRLVTLWGDRPGNDDHVLELTLRYSDGGLLATLLPGVDLPEGGIGTAG